MSRPSRALVTFLLLLLLVVSTRAAALAKDARTLRKAGSEHYKARRYFQAIESFQEAFDVAEESEKTGIRSDLARALGGLGFEYLDEAETRLAEETFRRALGHADDYFANFGLGYLYFMRREDGEARTYLLASLALRDDYGPTHKLLGLITYRKGQTKKALERLEKAKKLDAKDKESAYLVDRWKAELEVLGEFVDLRSAHFDLRVDPQLPEKVRRRVERELEDSYQRIGDALGVWPEERTPVVLFTPGRFHKATGSQHWVGGLYDGQLKLPVAEDVLDDPQALEDLVRVVRHEYSHVLVRILAAECPVWFNEGLAQYFEAQYFEALGTKRSQRIAMIHKRLREGSDARIPLPKMPARLDGVDDVDLARWIYLQGLGFVEFLAERYKPFRLRLFLRALSEEHSVSRAFERTYGASLADLEKEWWDSVEPPEDGN